MNAQLPLLQCHLNLGLIGDSEMKYDQSFQTCWCDVLNGVHDVSKIMFISLNPFVGWVLAYKRHAGKKVTPMGCFSQAFLGRNWFNFLLKRILRYEFSPQKWLKCKNLSRLEVVFYFWSQRVWVCVQVVASDLESSPFNLWHGLKFVRIKLYWNHFIYMIQWQTDSQVIYGCYGHHCENQFCDSHWIWCLVLIKQTLSLFFSFKF